MKEKGVGCIYLTLLEQQHLLQLRADDPKICKDSYITLIFLYSGNKVSSSFISSFFNKIGLFQGKFQQLSTVAIDNYCPSNIKTTPTTSSSSHPFLLV